MLARDYGQRVSEIFRKRRTEIEGLPCHRVVEREPRRVEEMPLGRKSGHTTSSAPSIHVVAHNRMADRREMNADLVSPSGMEMRTKKVPRVEPGKAYEVGLGRPTFIDDCHALPVSWITGYRFIDCEGVGGQMAPGHHGVPPDDPPGGDRRAQQPVRSIGLRDDQQAGRLLVEPVDHSGPFGLPFRGKAATSPQQRIDQGPAPVAGRGVHHHSRRFVDDKECLILVHDAYRNVFPADGSRLDSRNRDLDDLSRLGPITRFFPPAVDQHVALRDQSRGLSSRQLGPVGNKEIEADIAVRLDWKLSGVAQTLNLGLRIRHWCGGNDGSGRSLLSP